MSGKNNVHLYEIVAITLTTSFDCCILICGSLHNLYFNVTNVLQSLHVPLTSFNW